MGQGKKISYRVLETIRTAGIETPTALKQASRKARKFPLSLAIMVNTLRTGDADLRFYITTVQDG